MRVKAKLLVGGVRQMKFNEIPDILQNGWEGSPECKACQAAYMKLNWIHWIKGNQCRITHIMNWGCILKSWKLLTQLSNKEIARWTNNNTHKDWTCNITAEVSERKYFDCIQWVYFQNILVYTVYFQDNLFLTFFFLYIS